MSRKKVVSTEPEEQPVHVLVRHALLQHKITLMRDKECSASKFRSLVNEITLIMGVEATRDLPTEWAVARNSGAEGTLLQGPKPVIVAVLRAGLGMVDALLELMPSARIGHVGLHRGEEGLIQYLISLPDTERHGVPRTFFIVDPIIGTGNVAGRAIEIVKEQGLSGSNIKYITIVAAPEGLASLAEAHPDVPVYYADLADGLDKNLHVTPPRGDSSSKLFGIK